MLAHRLLAITLLTCGALVAGEAGAPVPFRPDLPVGTKCLIEPALLHPTQTGIGLREVQLRIAKMRRWPAKRLQGFLEARITPVVIGPGNEVYLLDHHHLARLLLESKLAPVMRAEIKANWAALPERDFWARMREHNWVYLADEAGLPLKDPSQLPKRVMDMRDDPYRSLSWLVRERHGYREVDAPFLEFRWADFFRSRISIGAGTRGFERALAKALRLCHSPEAKDLPGYARP